MTFEPDQSFVALFCEILIAAVFLTSGGAKLLNLQSFVETVRRFELLPDSLARFVGYVLPFTEVMLGLLLLVDFYRVLLLGIAVALLLTFSFGMAVNLIRGKTDISCGCFGSSKESLTWFLVVRNVVIIGVALTASLTAAGSVGFGERALAVLTVASLITSYYFYGLIVKFWQLRF